MNENQRLSILRDRARMLSISRHFFAEKNILEVDCPIITQGAPVDAHIDLVTADNLGEIRYMHSSPEYGMKRLISEGIGDIYQLSHVFRAGEVSSKHNPEFMMAEWYRMGLPFEQMILETCDYISLFLGDLPIEILSYREVFQKFVNIDYVHATKSDLIACLENHGIQPYDGLLEEGRDAILNLILGAVIEPLLGSNSLFVLSSYPSTQAALAMTQVKGDEVIAERFEVYYQGIELANGYHELVDANEQKGRFEKSNQLRLTLNKAALPVDELFLSALASGLPDCCGVAVGFDRLMMLRHQSSTIEKVIPFDWSHA